MPRDGRAPVHQRDLEVWKSGWYTLRLVYLARRIIVAAAPLYFFLCESIPKRAPAEWSACRIYPARDRTRKMK
eukprot:7032400-Pyramimonas_sp.AAC.1